MNIDAIQGISAVPKAISDLSTPSLNIANTSPFSDLIFSKIENVNDTLGASRNLVERYVADGDVAVHDVMIALGKARSELQLMVEIRNKLLEAYQEITRIQL